MDPVHLVELIFARKKRFFGDKLKKHASKTPNIHFLIIVAVSHQTLRGSIPPSWNVVGVRRRAMLAFARTQIC